MIKSTRRGKRTTSTTQLPAEVKKPPLPAYVLKASEEAARERTRRRRRTRPPVPKIILKSNDDGVEIASAHPDPNVGSYLLHDTFASASPALVSALVGQLLEAGRTGPTAKENELNQMLAVVRGISPEDETEALLAVQMAAIHHATMGAARRLNQVENIPQQDSASNMLNKLARTFAVQVETLKKYRSTGEQNIRVQHVTVNEGGQAIVAGQMQAGGGVSGQIGEQSHELSGSDATSPALLGYVEADGATVPSTGGKRQEGLQVSRSESRSAKGSG